jgi:hypothetical protein
VRHRSSQAWVIVALLLASGTALGGARAQDVRLEIVRLNGTTETGALVGLSPEVHISVADGVISLPWSEILSIRPAEAGPTTRPVNGAPLEVTLADGSVLTGEVTAGGSDRFVLRLASGEECRPDLAGVRSIRVRTASASAQERLTELLQQAASGTAGEPGADTGEGSVNDIVVAARGAKVVVLRGRILQLEPEHVLVEWNGRRVPVAWARLGGLIFAHPTVQRAPCIVRLNDGSAIAGQVVGGSVAALRLQSAAFANELQIPWTSVERIDCRSERLVILSDLQPMRYEFEPFFDKTWNYATDATLTGRPIRLGGRTFGRGLCMHSRSQLVYALDGQFERFTATAGILDEMGRRGCVALRVRGDGRVLWSAGGVRGGEPPREVSVDIAGVRELSLEVDYDADLDLSDQAAWGFARLIR